MARLPKAQPITVKHADLHAIVGEKVQSYLDEKAKWTKDWDGYELPRTTRGIDRVEKAMKWWANILGVANAGLLVATTPGSAKPFAAVGGFVIGVGAGIGGPNVYRAQRLYPKFILRRVKAVARSIVKTASLDQKGKVVVSNLAATHTHAFINDHGDVTLVPHWQAQRFTRKFHDALSRRIAVLNPTVALQHAPKP